MLGPPLLIGDRVAHVGGEEPVLASVRWLGRIPDLFHHQMVAGLFLVSPHNVPKCPPISTVCLFQDEPQILGTCNGSYANRSLFHCHPNHGKFVPLAELVKEEEFFNMLARKLPGLTRPFDLLVQLKMVNLQLGPFCYFFNSIDLHAKFLVLVCLSPNH